MVFENKFYVWLDNLQVGFLLMACFAKIIKLVNNKNLIFIKIFKTWFHFNLFYLVGQNGPSNWMQEDAYNILI